jgi:hypothetical protein
LRIGSLQTSYEKGNMAPAKSELGTRPPLVALDDREDDR